MTKTYVFPHCGGYVIVGKLIAWNPEKCTHGVEELAGGHGIIEYWGSLSPLLLGEGEPRIV